MKQRWKWTKHPRICPICKERIHNKNQFYKQNMVCSVDCGRDYYGY
jgi:hypothetical protein